MFRLCEVLISFARLATMTERDEAPHLQCRIVHDARNLREEGFNAMADFVRVDQTTVARMSEGAAEVLAHLCEGECQTYGSVLSWCETRGDCVHVVTCPNCGTE